MKKRDRSPQTLEEDENNNIKEDVGLNPSEEQPGSSLHDTSVKKLNSRFSPKGDMGQKYLASGIGLSMRLWENEQPGEAKPITSRNYETVGYVIQGRAELLMEGQTLLLEAGDSWTVPKGARHTYKIQEPFTAIEVTHPPAEIHNRDAVQKSA